MQITKETRKLKILLEEYNACNATVSDSYEYVSFEDMLDSSKVAQILNLKLSIYSANEQELIDAYLRLKRSIEEKELIRSEIKNVISYYEYRVEILAQTISSLSHSNEDYKRGGCALLKCLHKKASQYLLQNRDLLSHIMHHEDDSQHLTATECYDSDSSSNSGSDSDTDFDHTL